MKYRGVSLGWERIARMAEDPERCQWSNVRIHAFRKQMCLVS